MSCSLHLACILWAAAASTAWAGNDVVKPEMVGRWEGDGKIIVTWCQQTNLRVTLDVKADGTVTGKVGDATLTEGRFRRNRGWLGRKLNIKTDYIITGRLEGPIVSAEGVTRSGVNIPINYSTGTFTGALHTTGSKFGGKTRMILTARLNLSSTSPTAGGHEFKSSAQQKGRKE